MSRIFLTNKADAQERAKASWSEDLLCHNYSGKVTRESPPTEEPHLTITGGLGHQSGLDFAFGRER
jgi:hypothetical protein